MSFICIPAILRSVYIYATKIWTCNFFFFTSVPIFAPISCSVVATRSVFQVHNCAPYQINKWTILYRVRHEWLSYGNHMADLYDCFPLRPSLRTFLSSVVQTIIQTQAHYIPTLLLWNQTMVKHWYLFHVDCCVVISASSWLYCKHAMFPQMTVSQPCSSPHPFKLLLCSLIYFRHKPLDILKGGGRGVLVRTPYYIRYTGCINILAVQYIFLLFF